MKNNLQIIASILRLQMRREESPAAQEALGDAIHRIMGMVQVHELLSHARSEEVDLRELLDRLLDADVRTLLLPGRVIRREVRGEKITVDADTAGSIALAANEVIVNAIKHAFPGRREGRIDIRIGRDGEDLAVEVTDDGVGLPPGFDLTSSSNLGLRLVRSIVGEDLKGTLDISSDGGTRAVLRFPLPRREA